MKSTITELWRGNIVPFSEKHRLSDEENDLVECINRHYKEISNNLDESKKEALKKFEDCYDELILIKSENAFEKGFSLAVKLMTESLL